MAGTPTPFSVEIFGPMGIVTYEKTVHTGADGGWNQNYPPPTPDMVRSYLEAMAAYYPKNSWPDDGAMQAEINQGVDSFTIFTYMRWVEAPYNGSPNPAVRAWYDAARAQIGLPPAPPRPVDAAGNPV